MPYRHGIPQGRVAIVGAGPGDPDLLTRRAERLLAEAAAVVVDAGICADIFSLINSAAEKFAIGRLSHFLPVERDQVGDLLVRKALKGLRVVRLVVGDPYLYSGSVEEALAVREANLPLEIVPGVPRAIAAASRAGIPIVQQGLAATVLMLPGRYRQPARESAPASEAPAEVLPTAPLPAPAAAEEPTAAQAGARHVGGVVVRRVARTAREDVAKQPLTLRGDAGDPRASHPSAPNTEANAGFGEAAPAPPEPTGFEADVDWKVVSKAGDTLIAEGVFDLMRLQEGLAQGGRTGSEPVAIISQGGTAHQATVTTTLKSLASDAFRQALRPPFTVVVGDVVSLRGALNVYENRPLFGLRIAVCRGIDAATELVRDLEDVGARPEEFPVLQICPTPGLDDLIANLQPDFSRLNGIIVTSAAAARLLVQTFERLWIDWRVFPASALVVSIGDATRSVLDAAGLRSEVLDFDDANAAAVLAAMKTSGRNSRLLMVSEAGAWKPLLADLRDQRAQVTELVMYDQAPFAVRLMELRVGLTKGRWDLVLFTEEAAATAAIASWTDITARRLLRDATVCAQTRATDEVLRKAGIDCVVVSQRPDARAFADELIRWRLKLSAPPA